MNLPKNLPPKRRRDDKWIFLQEFLKHPLQVGSIIPSSRYMERRIISAADIASARVVVELGAGTGGVTRAILNALPRNAKLLSIEINPTFDRLLKSIEDDRLIVHQGSAFELRDIIASHDLQAPDVVISGIPFSTMSRRAGTQILNGISSQLSPSGRFVAYQFRSSRVATLCQPILGNEQATTEFLNIPPMRVLQWEKVGA
ncbi:MAG: class I SAM-dependent methyltransferase [Opitutales bacterium]